MITVAIASGMGLVLQRYAGTSIWLWIGFVGFMLVASSLTSGLLRWGCILGLVMAAMAIRWQADETRYRSSSVFWQVGDEAWPALVVGRVSGLVYRYPKPGMEGRSGADAWQTRFTLHVDQARDRDRWIQCAGGLAVSIDEDIPEIRGGDRLRIAGRLDGFRMPSNPGVRDRSLADRNRHQHARFLVRSRTQVEILDRPRWSLLAIADRLSRSGEQTLNACLGADTGALASALVVGRRYSLDVELQDQLLETGTVHMLSVSGLHLGILALSLRYLAIMLRLPRHWQWAFVAISCVVFAAVTGAQPPVIRAATLVGVMLLAYASNRVDSPLNSLSAAAFILMIINPTNLFQVGVQLSFLAVATLFVAGQRSDPIRDELRVEEEVNRMLRSTYGPWRRRFGLAADRLRDALWFSLCVTLTTTPLVWLHFNIVSPIAVVANVLLSLPLTVGLISGLVAVCIGWISPWLAAPAVWLCFGSLSIIQWFVGVAANVPWGHFWLPSPPAIWVVGYYLALSGGLILRGGGVPIGKFGFIACSCLWLLIGLLLAIGRSRSDDRHLTAIFLDVGHGTSVVLQLPDSRTMLYDCGSLGNQQGSARGIQEPLWAMGITRLNTLFLSHADADHYNALPGLLRRFRVDELVVPKGMFDSEKPGLIPIRDVVEKNDIKVREVSRWEGDRHGFGESIEIMHPPPWRIAGNDNANSLVIRFDHLGRSLLLPGDLEPPGLAHVLEQPRPSPGGVLMAPHHGSLTVDNRMILDWSRPREVIVSGGSRAQRPEVLDALGVRGSGVRVTARDGAIRVRLGESGIEVRSWREDPW